MNPTDKSYAVVSWSIEDVQEKRPKWSKQRCADWLAENAKHIQEAMISAGWDAIEALL